MLNHENKVFVGKRIDHFLISKNNKLDDDKFWQMPQGGINNNEDFKKAAKRELEEETGIISTELIKELDGWLEYELPKELVGKIWSGKFRGQKQKWFIMKFIGSNNEINIKTKNPEFLNWKWIDISNLPNVAVEFKKHIYEKLKKELNYMNLN